MGKAGNGTAGEYGSLSFTAPRSPSWYVWLDNEPHPGSWNMAADASLLRAAQAGESWMRLYRWSPGCLSFGRNEPALSRYDRDRIASLGLDTVRRPTGGRAVWHNAEVTYAIAAPLETFGSLTDTYLAIHQVLAAALRKVGVPAEIAARPSGRHPGLAAGSCFASPAGGEVVVGGRKLVGSAQVREGTAFLQHGSILLEDGQDVVTGVTRGGANLPHSVSLAELLGRRPDFDEIAGAIATQVDSAWSVSPTYSPVPADELIRQFEDPAWTWRR